MQVNEYRQVCQKGEFENYFFDKYFFRKISIYFTIIFIKLRIKANTTTFISLFSCFLACFFSVYTETIYLAITLFFILLFYTLDHVDGELARYYIWKGVQKPALSGQYFDQLVHKYSANLFLFFFGYTAFVQYGYTWILFFGFVACMTLSGFPNIMAAKVILQRFAKSVDLDENTEMLSILNIIEQKNDAIQIIQHGKGFKKYKKIAGEILVFPGGVLLCMVVLLLDMFIVDLSFFGYQLNFRMLLVLFLTPVYILKTILDWINWMKRLNKVS